MDSQVQPLRIAKSAPLSPNMAAGRPLSEIASTSQRRNSPSYNQATRKAIVSKEASPYTENQPSQIPKPSPRDFWSTRDPMSPRSDENTPDRSPSPSAATPRRRPSVERLMQASRVKNSNMFSLQNKDAYDPSTVPIVERPSANRPMSQQLANNAFARFDSQRKENNPLRSPAHARSDSQSSIPIFKSPASTRLPPSPEKQPSPSPTKSSLARRSQFGAFQEPDEVPAPTRRGLHRQNKSVTFHEEPPIVNEYEQQTPEPSVSVASDCEGSWDSEEYYEQEMSFERGNSTEAANDDSFDADLENADKTPVVLPEDWSRMSPDAARTALVDGGDDVFGESNGRPILGRSESVTSDGEPRPLPPIPTFHARKRESDTITAAAERASLAARGLPSPPKRASCSKEDILKMTSQSSLSLQDRLSLMSKQSPRNSPHPSPVPQDDEEQEMVVTNLDTGEKQKMDAVDIPDLAPRISRESILRKVRNTKYDFEDDASEDEGEDNQHVSAPPNYAELARMDPDQPIPSRESSRETSNGHHGVGTASDDEITVKAEPTDDDGFDLAAIPSLEDDQLHNRSLSRMEDYEQDVSVIRHSNGSDLAEHEGGSTYSDSPGPHDQGTPVHDNGVSDGDDGKESLQDAMQLLTVQDYSEPAKHGDLAAKASMDLLKQTAGDNSLNLPTYLSTDDYDFGLKKFITPSPPPTESSKQREILLAPIELKPPHDEGPEQSDSRPGSANSVLQFSEYESYQDSDFMREEPPEIPERRATIKTGGKLKTRPSASAVDFQLMAEQRRIVSAEHPVPPIPQAYQAEFEQASFDEADQSGCSSDGQASKADSAVESQDEERTKKLRECKSMPLSLEIPAINQEDVSDGLGLDAEFDKVIESSKKGYVTRENTKVVVASNRNFSGESNGTLKSNDSTSSRPSSSSRTAKHSGQSSARQPSAEQFLKTEPWNGAMRRQSSRKASMQKSAYAREAAPPLPNALSVVNEDFVPATASLEEDVEDGIERGRLFVKVVGVKNLDLPLPRNDKLPFQLTLDNGLHCVTTADLDLGRSAPIGQEFELVVLNDLEFQLTLTTKLPAPPASNTASTRSPVKPQKAPKSGLSRFLTSPKKRAEKERQEREAAEAEERRLEEESRRRRATAQPTAWDLLHELVNAADGSFARAYVNLKSHERQCFGRQLTINVPCYNEWALENDVAVMSSVRSKRGTSTGPIRKPPYIVGYLELQLLYVPKPRDAKDEDMPKSMSGAVREINKASENREVVYEGHLSQQGGDCIHWRRRFFRLQGPRLTAYHEHTHQKRAVINLSKASRLVDDRSMLIADPTNNHKGGKGRRKSAFAEEDEGYQYVEEGFRIRFSNGETIDFYADSRAEKERWMEVLSKVIGKADSGKKATSWTDLVLAREKIEGINREATDAYSNAQTAQPLRKESKRKTVPGSAPSSPVKQPVRPKTPPMSERRAHRSRDAVKSTIF